MLPSKSTLFSAIILIAMVSVASSGCLSFLAETPTVHAYINIEASTNKSQVESDYMNGARAGGQAGNCLFFNYNIATGGDESLKEGTLDRLVVINKDTRKVSNW